MSDEVKEWKPKHPRTAMFAEALRNIADSSKIGDFLLGGKADVLERIAYGKSLTTGKGMTTGVRPETMELTDFVPGPGTLAKGAKSAVVIGAAGIDKLGDQLLRLRSGRLVEKLLGRHPDDWKSQLGDVKDAGFVPIPRGRDLEPDRPILHFGYEIPEGELTDNFRRLREKARDIESQFSKPLHKLYESPRLLRAYPHAGNMEVVLDGALPEGRGGFLPKYGRMKIGVGDAVSEHAEPPQHVIQHELQHAIQATEGWPGGTNPTMATALLDRLKGGEIPHKEARKLESLLRVAEQRPELAQHVPYTIYRREAGEQLAEAAAGSAMAGGGRIDDFYTIDPKGMYDIRVLLPDWYK